MDDRGPSITAARVAAHRLDFTRVATVVGRPGDDDALTGSVAAGQLVDRSDPMYRYLQARTDFFDRAVVDAIARGVRQIANIGAGYDGRAWRYHDAGVSWWEIDLEDTQHDKVDRLDRLGISHGHVRFIDHDLSHAGVAAKLVHAGFEADAPALFACEGVVVYLDERCVLDLLGELRAVAIDASRLALSLRTSNPTPAGVTRRMSFDSAVAAAGEPALNTLTAATVAPLLATTRWRTITHSAPAARAGLVLAEPV